MAWTDPFINDFNKTLKDDAELFNEYQQEEIEAQKAYTKAFNSIFSSKNPELVYMALIFCFSNQGFSELDGGLAVNGESVQVQGDLTKLGNDLENLSNMTSPPEGVDPRQLLKDEATDLDYIMNSLTPSANLKPGAQKDWYTFIQKAIGSTGAQSLSSEYLTIRQDIYYAEDAMAGDNTKVSYNPNPVVPAPNSGPRTYHYNPDDPLTPKNGPDGKPYGPDNDPYYISNFGDRNSYMQQQGDIDQANEASKKWTDAFNTNTSTTQSTQAASNEVITNDSNTIKTFQAFVTDMMHALQDTIKAAVTNQTKQ